ncbi:MAG: hypothetical protein ACPGN7_06555, partial [Nitrosopumilus sp.]
MKTQLLIFALFGILITTIGITPVFGENVSIIATTDKLSYSEDEIISISGEIVYLGLGNQLTIMITSPNGNIAAIDQVTVGSDKKFNSEIKPNGAYWKIPGTYTILITQDENNQTTLSFEFAGMVSLSPNESEDATVEDATVEDATVEDATVEDSFIKNPIIDDVEIVDSLVTTTTVTVQDSNDLISYEITNAKLLNIIPDLDAVSLLIYIETTDAGSITLTIPRTILDASINGGDDEFFVLVDGEEVDFEEIRTS